MAHAGGTNATVKSNLTPTSGPVVANWNSGVATSGLAGADVVTIGAANTDNILHSTLVNIGNLTVAATITIRIYMAVDGGEALVYDEDFTVGTDPPGVWIINGILGIHQPLRVEMFSNNALDDGAIANYDYLLEAAS